MRIQYLIALCVVQFSIYSIAQSVVLRVDKTLKFVTISQNYEDPWCVEDEVCITRGEKEVACGLVKFSEPDSAIVKINKYSQKLEKKQDIYKDKTFIELQLTLDSPEELDSVRLVSRAPKIGIKKILKDIEVSNPFNSRKISFQEDKNVLNEKTKLEEMRKLKSKIYWSDDINPVSAISLGLDYAWPFIEYTQSVNSKSAITLRAIKLNYPVGEGLLDGLGGYLTYNFFPFRPLRGLWFQSGIGVYSLKVTRENTTASTWTPGLINTIGYKVVWKEALSFACGGGVEYLPTVNGGSVKLDFSGFLPTCILSAGYFF